MKMNLNVRKEVFESLRLELQEFTPQEFIAGCFRVTIPCISSDYVSTTHGSGNTGVRHNHNNFFSEIITFSNKDIEPSRDEIKNKLTNVVDPGYTSDKRNFNNNYTTGFLFGSSMHFSQWSSVIIESIATPDHPNAS